MARKSPPLECQDCVTKFTVSSSTPEPVAHCPFCGSESVADNDFEEEDDRDEEDDDE